MEDARNRLVAAALRFASAERGGLDQEDDVRELELAGDILTDAARRYVRAVNDADVGSQAPAGEQVAE